MENLFYYKIHKLAIRQAHIFYKDQLAGILTENYAGYEFRYFPR